MVNDHFQTVNFAPAGCKTNDSMAVIILSDMSTIDVINLHKHPFKPTPGRIQLYGKCYRRKFAFEMDFNEQNIEMFGKAIRWYVDNKLLAPDMELVIDDPRPIVN